MTAIKGTRTEKNLLAAFAGECQSGLRYAFYAKRARKDGFEQVSAVFLETAEQEKAHASRMRKLMEGLEAEVSVHFRAVSLGSTLENLREAATGESRVGEGTYPGYAEVAREEGFNEAALVFEHIARAERRHRDVYQALADNIESGRAFEREAPVVWRCRKCGWVHEGKKAPERCPACDHKKAYFEIAPANW